MVLRGNKALSLAPRIDLLEHGLHLSKNRLGLADSLVDGWHVDTHLRIDSADRISLRCVLGRPARRHCRRGHGPLRPAEATNGALGDRELGERRRRLNRHPPGAWWANDICGERCISNDSCWLSDEQHLSTDRKFAHSSIFP